MGNEKRRTRYAKDGVNFEKRFKDYVDSIPGCCAIKIADGCRRIGAFQLIPVAQPWDFVVGYKDKVIFVDTKTVLSNSYPLKSTPAMEKKTRHQIDELYKLHRCGQASGFLVEYRGECEYRWFPSHMLKGVIDEWKSLKREEGILVGIGFVVNIDFDKILNS